MLWIEAEVNVEETIETLSEQAGSDEQNHRDCELRNHQIGPDTAPELTCGGTASVIQPFADILEREAEDRCEHHESCGKDRNDCGEKHDVRMKSDVMDEWHLISHGFGNQFPQC